MDREKLEEVLPLKPSEIFWKSIEEYKVDLISLSLEERDNCILEILRVLDDNNIIRAGRKRQNDWFKGWEENYKSFCNSDNPEDLIPKYYNKYQYLRFNSELYKVKNSNAELNSVRILINYITDIYLRNYTQIIELGAGTCHHIMEISNKLKSNPTFFALDWSETTTSIAKKLKLNNHINSIYSFKFDFFNPKWDDSTEIPKENESVIYSFAALEQVGKDFNDLFNFIKDTIKPKIVIHIEPIAELLPQNQLLSYLSTKYFQKRNYLNGYLSFLREREKAGKIKIHLTSRMPFGSLFIEGYSLIVWSPCF